MEEEDDYMSASVLQKCADVRPGVASTRAGRRQRMQERKRQSAAGRMPSRAELQRSRLESGLSTALGEENKGYALLMKMGYKPGSALGSQANDAGNRLTEPLTLSMKSDRKGLGHEEPAKRRKAVPAGPRVSVEVTGLDYLSRRRAVERHRILHRDLRIAQKACHTLDSSANVNEPVVDFFWPKYAWPDESVADDAENADVEMTENLLTTRLQRITEYLRGTYLYCIWCGITYLDAEDLSANCPGNTADAH